MGLGSALGNLGSSLISGLFGQSSARDQMDFQRNMANTQYTRAARDLERAGLNRILALGSPAAAPSGASASMPDARMGDAYVSGSSAKQAIKVGQAQENLFEEQSLKTMAETEEAYSRTRVNNATAKEIAARIPTHDSLITLQGKQGGLADAQANQDVFFRSLQAWGAEAVNRFRANLKKGMSPYEAFADALQDQAPSKAEPTVPTPIYLKKPSAGSAYDFSKPSSPSRGKQRGVRK